ncbi:TetR/AcrR family transcriptional regulator [Actinoplanes sp. NPDC049599]|uniref:TetR/AcrR family transcriptional regulator n=1 Tax=Actinoplanes sp. NPDC049599 TaxID=3363903 RepID=UPI0037AC139B
MPPPPADSRRTYDSSGRQEQARRRRAEILNACRDALVRQGYAGLTIRAVAEAAGVSQETVYKTFGGKRGLVKAMYDVTLAGDDTPLPMAQRPEVQKLLTEPDPAAKITSYAGIARGVSERLGAVMAALSTGGPEAAEIGAETDRERLIGVTAFVGHLAEGGHLSAGRDLTAAAEEAWLLTAPEVYRLCTAERGWSADRYEDWLRRMLTAVLLGSA